MVRVLDHESYACNSPAVNSFQELPLNCVWRVVAGGGEELPLCPVLTCCRFGV